MPLDREAVIVLTGGASARLGEHKPAVVVGGRSMLGAVLDAAGARTVVIAGSSDGAPPDVPVVADRRPGGGPVEGITSGMRWLADRGHPPDGFATVFVLAADQPFLTGDALRRLAKRRQTADADVAVYVDSSGRRQSLCAAWAGASLQRVLGGLAEPHGASVRALFAGVTAVEVRDDEGVAIDVDTVEELQDARDRVRDRSRRDR